MCEKRNWIIQTVTTSIAVLGLCVLELVATPARALTVVIDTTGGSIDASVAAFGDGFAGQSYGQTFVAPAGNSVLNDFSFWVWHAPDLDTSGQPLQFTAIVAAWATDRAAEPVLFESAIQTIEIDQTTPQEFVFTTGDLQLTPGQKYVAFLNAATEFWDLNTTRTRVGFEGGGPCCGGGDAYVEGEAWLLSGFFNGVFDVNFLVPWDNQFGVSDLAFRATFSPVPIPGAVWLFASALGLLSWLRSIASRTSFAREYGKS